jgi:hypothetical protein
MHTPCGTQSYHFTFQQGDITMKDKRRLMTGGVFTTRLLSALIIVFVVTSAAAWAQYPPNHNFYPGRKCEINASVCINGGAAVGSSGLMDMIVTASSPTGVVPHWQTLHPISFHSAGFDPQLGNMSWDLDDDATRAALGLPIVADSKIEAHGPDSDFPATCDIFFYVRATCDAFPGVTFRSMTPVHMQSTSLMTFSPHVNELYTSVGPVNFEDAGTPGAIAFTVTCLSSILN